MPYEPQSLTLSPADANGNAGGLSGFSREYADGVEVKLAAPAAVGPHTFVKWLRNGNSFGTNATATVTMDADYHMAAVYFANNQVLVNGSFEDGSTNWSLSGNVLVENGLSGTATDGTAWVVYNSAQTTPNGVVSQSFATVPGQSYTLDYDVGILSFSTNQQRLQYHVMGNTQHLSGTEILTGVNGGLIRWFPKSYEFTADSEITTVTFTDVSPTSNSLDLYLDKVRVFKSIPTPSEAPIALDDAATLHPGQKVLIPVLENDFGIMDQGTVVVVDPPAIGSATVRPDGKILYSHPGGDWETVDFTYRVSGEGGDSNPATVSITVSSALRIPSESVKFPPNPPETSVQVVPAFPGLAFVQPLCFVSPPNDTKRLIVCERGGGIHVIPDVTAVPPTSSLMLDLAQVVVSPPRVPLESWDPGAYEESGLMGMAFHPDFAENGYLYVSYLVKKANDTSANISGRIVPVLYQRLSRFTVPAAQIGLPAPEADPASELILIEQRDRGDGHNCSDIHFGPDGYLYWVIGDETNPNDIFNNSQRIDMNFFGAMLRIDVDKRPGNLEPNLHPNPSAASLGFSNTPGIPRDEVPAGSGNFVARYSIPIDNPYVPVDMGGTWDGTFNGSPISAGNLPYVRSEFWAVGLRSPWRFSIDKTTGDIWLGDVGQDKYEELNLIVRGGNYGWAFRDGMHPGPKTAPAGFVGIDPIYEYLHTNQPGGNALLKGKAIIGGVVYRGERFASLSGAYIFGDHVSGHIWALMRDGGNVTVERIAGLSFLSTFGTDPSNGDVLVSDYTNGRVMRIITTTPVGSFPQTLGATGLFTDLADLSPAPGVLPYGTNLSFWSDYALKKRWFSIPDPAAKMTWTRDGPWEYPAGQVWVKHFDLETERGVPSSPLKRIETRVLVRNEDGIYGVSYRWNEGGTEAYLAPDGGDDFPLQISVDGAPYEQQWGIPSRSQCIACHNPQAGHALSFNTLQLNNHYSINEFTGNQITQLHQGGYLHNTPDSPNFLPRHLRPDETDHPLEARVRSFLDVNCSYCHAGSSGTAPGLWDGRHELTLEQTGLINGASSVAGGDFRLIVPGDATHSVALRRMEGSGDFSRMPPLGTFEIDPVNIALVTEWINQALPSRQTYAQWREQQFNSPYSPEGEPGVDADGDGVSNRDEYLAGTIPTDGSSRPTPTLTRTGDEVSFQFSLPENRSVQVEVSNNLLDWYLWDIPENNSMTLPAGQGAFSGASDEPAQFFRMLIRER